MGISALPTAAQRFNEKSGIALERIQNQQERGSYHFIDAYEDAIEQTGRILDDLLDSTYDTEREVGLRKPDDKQIVVPINTREPVQVPGSEKPVQYQTGQGDHDITISTGQSYDSQREEASEFADTLAQIPELLPRIADLVVKLKNLGPIGDEIAKRLAPPDQNQQGQAGPGPAQVQALMQQHEQLTQALNGAQQKLESKQAELDSKERIAAADNATQIKIAEMNLAAKAGEMETKHNLEEFRQDVELSKARMDMRHDDERADIAAGQAAQSPPDTE
jgi:hypothetical protein